MRFLAQRMADGRRNDAEAWGRLVADHWHASMVLQRSGAHRGQRGR